MVLSITFLRGGRIREKSNDFAKLYIKDPSIEWKHVVPEFFAGISRPMRRKFKGETSGISGLVDHCKGCLFDTIMHVFRSYKLSYSYTAV